MIDPSAPGITVTAVIDSSVLVNSTTLNFDDAVVLLTATAGSEAFTYNPFVLVSEITQLVPPVATASLGATAISIDILEAVSETDFSSVFQVNLDSRMLGSFNYSSDLFVSGLLFDDTGFLLLGLETRLPVGAANFTDGGDAGLYYSALNTGAIFAGVGDYAFTDVSTRVAPEPSTASLFALAGLFAITRRRR